jgi:DNA-binding transcriptional ArsR family regulator
VRRQPCGVLGWPEPPEVAPTDRDLVAALRAELASIDPARACDRNAERVGLETRSRTGDPVLARLALRLERGEGQERGRSGAAAAFDWDAAPEHCRMAWLRGRFLARGSLSLAGGRTHLELVLPSDEAARLAARLGAVGLPASWRVRRGRGVVTWKSAETVDLFLRRIGAGPSLLQLEARQVARSLRGELNRVINAESANLGRSVAAAGRQLEAIDRLAADGRLAAESAPVRAVAAARADAPEATLSELAEAIGVHRSAVQRALERLERLAADSGPPGAPLA